MPFFSKNSLNRLSTCDKRLQEICNEVIKIYDFCVICGKRDEERQNMLLTQGKTTLEFPKSKHNKYPSQAIDIAPYPIDWHDHDRFKILAGIMFGVAHSKNIKIRWGGDWNMNWIINDEKLVDLVHFELV
jgi:peptidoglycan L-alanyl-D-glutamate endopeptidase CwlK